MRSRCWGLMAPWLPARIALDEKERAEFYPFKPTLSSPSLSTNVPIIPNTSGACSLQSKLASQNGEPEHKLFFPISPVSDYRAKLRITVYAANKTPRIELVSSFHRVLGRFYYISPGKWQFSAETSVGNPILTDTERVRCQWLLKHQTPNEVVLPTILWPSDEMPSVVPLKIDRDLPPHYD